MCKFPMFNFVFFDLSYNPDFRCSRLGLVSLAYLWRRDQAELLDEMISSKIDSILIKVATLGLDQKHLGKSLSEVRNHLHSMVSGTVPYVCKSL